MRFLAVFGVVCVALAGLLVWNLLHGRPAPAPAPARPIPVTPRPAAPPPPSVAAEAATAVLPHPVPPSPESRAAAPVSPTRDLARMPLSAPRLREPRDPATAAAQDALARARAALATDPYHEPALRDLLEAALMLKRYSVAYDAVARLRTLHPDDAELWFEYAALLLRQRRFVETVAELNAYVRAHPDDVRAWHNLATSHQRLGHLAAARDAWSRVIALQPDAEALARRGEILLDLQDYAAAAADFEAVLQNTPDADDAVLNLALALEHLGRVADAQRRLVDFVQQHPRHIPALNRLSRLASEQCHAAAAARATPCAEAAEWCRRSLAINPDQPEVQARLASVSDRPAAEVGHGGG